VQVSDLPTIEADSLQMNQLIENLISNSIKFHKKDCPPVVRITSQNPDGSSNGFDLCEIHIEDEGIGFDEKYLERIFQPFQRVHNRADYTGLGMGLAICKKIVNLHGGTITANSHLGIGTTFIIQLPLHQRNERQG
jgi:signal transduction histidine kinase